MATETLAGLILQFGALGILFVLICYTIPKMVEKIIKSLEKRDEFYTKSIDRISSIVDRNNGLIEKFSVSLERLVAFLDKFDHRRSTG